jgi:hypothetical protein
MATTTAGRATTARPRTSAAASSDAAAVASALEIPKITVVGDASAKALSEVCASTWGVTSAFFVSQYDVLHQCIVGQYNVEGMNQHVAGRLGFGGGMSGERAADEVCQHFAHIANYLTSARAAIQAWEIDFYQRVSGPIRAFRLAKENGQNGGDFLQI